MGQWVLTDVETLRWEEASPASLPAGFVRIRPAYCGICGSDLHSYRGKHPLVHPPIVLGHEFSGTVVEVGSGVDPNWQGRAVVGMPSLACGTCYACRHGAPHICHRLRVIGNVSAPGALADELVLPVENVLALPAAIDLKAGALVEPLAVAVHALRRVGLVGGQALVIGAGPIGLLTGLAGRALGMTSVAITDLREARLLVAESLGLQPIDAAVPEWQQAVRTLWEEGPDVIFDCVATTVTMGAALSLARKGSTVVLIGVPEEPLQLDAIQIQDHELDVIGSAMYRRDDFLTAIRLVANRGVEVHSLITSVVPLAQADDAFRRLADDPGDAVKVLIDVAGTSSTP